ncbi:MAG: hypothetical protein QE284_04415 [Rhizobium sp.]|nr:hypothetical protein [Rhizobium sp.]
MDEKAFRMLSRRILYLMKANFYGDAGCRRESISVKNMTAIPIERASSCQIWLHSNWERRFLESPDWRQCWHSLD